MFYNYDKRIIYAVLIIMAVFGLRNYIYNPSLIVNLLLTIPGVVIAITLHEFAHAFAADKLGDDTPRVQGRLSLNPLAHIDPIGFMMLVFAGFGWGKPVNVNPRSYSRKLTMERANAIVSAAGPLINFVLAIIFTVVYFLLYRFTSIGQNHIGTICLNIILNTVIINIGLGVFNLIPLPPLDGSKIIRIFLPYNAKTWFDNNEYIFYAVFVLLWISGIAGTIISPIINSIFKGLMSLGMLIFHI